jgi:hypothetical protein
MSEAASKVAEIKRTIMIQPSHMQLAEYERQDWVANAPEGVTPDDLKNPAFWALMSSQFKPFDRIDVRADDGSWLAEVIVKQADRNYAHVQVLNVYKLDATEATKDSEYEVEWTGPQKKWCVKRLSDDELIKTGCDTKVAANDWLANQRKAM